MRKNRADDGREAHAAPNISVMFHTSSGLETGRNCITHPYAGQILVAPAHILQKYINPGPGLLEAINVHSNGTLIIDRLE